jgi:fumarylacetoacetase
VSSAWPAISSDSAFGLTTLPYGVFSTERRPTPRPGVAVGEQVLDLAAAARALQAPFRGALDATTLNPLLAAGPTVWRQVRTTLTDWLTDPAFEPALRPHLFARDAVRLHLPLDVADYVDFYSSEHHAANVGRMLRPDAEPLLPNWKHLPVGYHGRSGTVVLSGTPIVRPSGQRKAPTEPAPTFGPSRRLDVEAEVGFVVGVPSRLGVQERE